MNQNEQFELNKGKTYKTGFTGLDKLFGDEGGIETGITTIITEPGTHGDEFAIQLANGLSIEKPINILNYDLKCKFNNSKYNELIDSKNIITDIKTLDNFDKILESMYNKENKNTSNVIILNLSDAYSIITEDNGNDRLSTVKMITDYINPVFLTKSLEYNIFLFLIIDMEKISAKKYMPFIPYGYSSKVNTTLPVYLSNTMFRLGICNKLEDGDIVEIKIMRSKYTGHESCFNIFKDNKFNYESLPNKCDKEN